MKPRTKLQRRIVAASGRLPEITPAQLHWGYAHLLPHEAFRTKRGKITCTECRHTWQGDQQIDRAVCPHCGVRLTVVTTRRRTSWNKAYLSVVTTREGLQVIRYFLLERRVRDGHPRTLQMLRGHAALDRARRKIRYRSTPAQYILVL